MVLYFVQVMELNVESHNTAPQEHCDSIFKMLLALSVLGVLIVKLYLWQFLLNSGHMHQSGEKQTVLGHITPSKLS